LTFPPEQTGGATGTLEMAHVLFMDIVGYSKLHMEVQRKLVKLLQEMVRNTAEFAHAHAKKKLVCLPTGDGLALVFFGDPEAPVRCAVDLGSALRHHPELKLRMGIHAGPIYRVPDINANVNVAGVGINMAQRVMDCGDEGHILVSRAVADTLSQLGKWENSLKDLGEAEVKHGVHIHVYNLHTADAGNPEPPQKLRRASSAEFASAGPAPAQPAPAAPAPVRAAIEPAVIEAMTKELAAFVGPTARILVRRAAERCGSVAELYTTLAGEIDVEKDRSSFLAGAKRRHPQI